MNKENDDKPVDLGRRRLTKGGLAGSAVLATLASKNVLAGFPYQCGLSGKLSNNVSPKGPKTTELCKLGMNSEYWVRQLVNDDRRFNTLFGVERYYFVSDKISSQGGPGNAATFLQILTAGESTNNPPRELPFAKVALVIYLNAPAVRGDQYPLIQQQVVDMFNAVIDPKDYTYETSAGPITMSPDGINGIRDYFDKLYPG